MDTTKFDKNNNKNKKNSMDSKVFKFNILNGSIAKQAFFRALFLASAISLVSLYLFLSTMDFVSLTPKTYIDCLSESSQSQSKEATVTPGSYLFQSRVLNTFWGSFESLSCSKHLNLTLSVVKKLIGKRLLTREAESLCLGQDSSIVVSAMQQLGFSSIKGVYNHSVFSIKQKKNIVHELQYLDCSFDFVFSKDLDNNSVPASLVFEVERILKPGGIGALLVGPAYGSVSSLLRSSNVVHVDHVNELSVVVFKKRSENRSSLFCKYNFPSECASVTLTKPFIELMEPLVDEITKQTPPFEYEKRISYLPKFVDLFTRKKLVYIDIEVEGLLNANVTDWFLPFYPIDQKAFNAYLVHHNTSIMLSHVKRPGVTFVYHPRLAGNIQDPNVEEELVFLKWFQETVRQSDFVVLKMNAGKAEMKLLTDLVKSGAICSIDEIFLSCSGSGDGNGKTLSRKKSCMDIYKGLRSCGVYVHQWWETKLHQGLSQVVNVQ
ncbi:hypothetical protein TanjilG_31231 [Lupinus angustifolius]|uniref:DUF7870 domain-containing protein n=1 Tax=Lupinus angustifolius TaxID=3871 RepID=A0A394DD90_LUPAN|nr:PREDICTED: uncharacterized protein LOC109339614 [Lupinus angustifolius]OIW21260.1 hypothetical protein TanjilG_31231 [Lupinus angustifolius]